MARSNPRPDLLLGPLRGCDGRAGSERKGLSAQSDQMPRSIGTISPVARWLTMLARDMIQLRHHHGRLIEPCASVCLSDWPPACDLCGRKRQANSITTPAATTRSVKFVSKVACSLLPVAELDWHESRMQMDAGCNSITRRAPASTDLISASISLKNLAGL